MPEEPAERGEFAEGRSKKRALCGNQTTSGSFCGVAGDVTGNDEDMAVAGSDASDLMVVCPNVMCDGIVPLSEAAHGSGVFSCPRCGEVFRLGSDADMNGVVDLRLTDLDRPGARPPVR